MSHSVVQANLRSLFLSDLHLGARAADPQSVLGFLAAHEAEVIYLVGDILDLWHGGRVHWGRAHDAVIAELERRAAQGVRVVYLAGNHDAVMRNPGAARLPAGWELRETLVHRAADGRHYLVLHGDQADNRLLRWHAMTRLGSRTDAALRALDDWLAHLLGPRKADVPSRIQRAISVFNGLFVMGDRFERRLVAMARAFDAQGVICGHSHKPMLRDLDGALYANCGDWTDSFTALTEAQDGSLRLVAWTGSRVPRLQGAPAHALAGE